MQRQKARLESWWRFGEVLIGLVYGHPRFPDGTAVTTSQVVEQGEGWAKTLNTDYELGQSVRDAPLLSDRVLFTNAG